MPVIIRWQTMTRRASLVGTVMVLLLAGSDRLPLPSYGAESLRAGAATSNITPRLGGEIIGGFAGIPARHIHDELHARCLVLDDGRQKLALVVCDLLAIPALVSQSARTEIEKTLGIPAANVLISATHTHSATSALGSNRFATQKPLDDYQQFVVERIVDGVHRAHHLLRPAEIAFGTVSIPEHVFNRRWKMAPGTMPVNPFGQFDQVKMNPPAGSPNLLEPAGPTDPDVSIIAVREPQGRWISVYASYSLHYVGGVGPGHISSDYFGMLCERLRVLLEPPSSSGPPQDPPFVGLLANGTSGDINNINFRTPRPSTPAYTQMRFVAHDIAAKIAATVPNLVFRRDVVLASRYREPIMRWRKPTPEQLAWAEETLATRPAEPGKTDLSRIYAERTRSLADYPETTPVPLQVLDLGIVTIGTMPVEVFCEIGLDFKQRAALQPAFLVSLTHGSMGYLPTPAQHDLGGYETWIGTNRLQRDASDIMTQHLLEMTLELQAARTASPAP